MLYILWNRLWYPASLCFLQSSVSADESSTLVVAEGSQVKLRLLQLHLPYFLLIGFSCLVQLQLSVWDLRTNSNGGCVQRVCGSVGDLIYAVCSSPSGPIAAGGSDRTVTIYDPRRLVAS